MQGQQYPQGPYASNLLNDIHNYFPNLLYLPGRFNSVRDVMQYIQQQMSARYDTFSSWRSYYERMDNLERIVQQAQQQQQPQQQQPQQQRRNYQQTHWNQPRQQHQQQPRPRVYVPPSPEVQVTAELDQTALNTMLNQAFLGGQNQTNDTFTNTLLRYIFNPLDTTNANANRTTPFWEPVLVVPTATQIAAASTTYAAPTALDTPCAICQDVIAEGAQVRKLTFCNHFFHKDCVDNWFQRDTRCPTCRHDVRIRSTNATATNTTAS
jgi:hypothetical protein